MYIYIYVYVYLCICIYIHKNMYIQRADGARRIIHTKRYFSHTNIYLTHTYCHTYKGAVSHTRHVSHVTHTQNSRSPPCDDIHRGVLSRIESSHVRRRSHVTHFERVASHLRYSGHVTHTKDSRSAITANIQEFVKREHVTVANCHRPVVRHSTPMC